MRGCSFGGYFSSNGGTLIAAERTGNMTLQPDSIVVAVLHDPKANKATGVRVRDATTGKETEYYAKVIFLCASTLNTAWIMLHSTSDRFPNGFGNDSDQVGRNVMDHHFLVGAQADVDGYEDRYYAGRRPNGIYIPRFRNLGDNATKQKDFIRGYGYQGGASREGWQRLVAEMGFGAEMKNALKDPGPWTMGMTAFGEMLPYEDNRVTMNSKVKDINGLPTLTMDVRIRENELNMRKDMQSSAIEMMETAGFKNVQGYDRPYGPGLGIHEMGTARMGRDPKTSVLNAHNQVHGCTNVYVTDGACMTSTACVNPSLTYMALTARACAATPSKRSKAGEFDMIDRRELIHRAGLLLGGAVASSATLGILSGCVATPALAGKADTKFLTAAELADVAAISEQIIPRTDSPGAIDVGVPAFIDRMMADYYQQRERNVFRAGLVRVAKDAQAAHGMTFALLSSEQQIAMLRIYDREAYDQTNVTMAKSRPSAPHFFRTCKELTTLGFFTSETGASKFLKYEAVPGKYRGDIPYSEIGREWAT